MKTLVFSTKPYDRQFFEQAAQTIPHEFTFLEERLTAATASLAAGFPAVCAFVNDNLSAEVLQILHAGGTRFVALRCAGFNQVDLPAGKTLGMRVARVPAYSPYSVAEHAAGLVLLLNRKLHRAYNRVREGNFALQGLLGFDLHGKTVGLVGMGTIGRIFAQIMRGFGCRVLAYDPAAKPDANSPAELTSLEAIWKESDIISLHCPLLPSTHHLVNDAAIAQMKRGVMLINTSRGGIVDTQAIIRALKNGQLGSVGLDVYEEEADYFFEDFSGETINDDTLARLLTFPNAVVTSHQAFFTREALTSIAETTARNLQQFEQTGKCKNEVHTK